MKGASKLSNKANKIIDDINRTETSIKYRGKGCNGKIAIGYLLELYADDDERKFIQKYVETNSACFGTSITICAYVFAMAAILFTLLWPYLYIHIYKTPVQLYLLVLSLILIYLFRRVFFDTFPKLERNKAIIMSIEDKWKDQDESYSNPNTKKEEKGGTTMKNGYNIAFIGWIFGALTVMVTMIVIYLMGINYKLSSDDATPILTFILVAVTARYAWSTHMIVKQGADRERIAFIERKMEKFYFPMLELLAFLNVGQWHCHDGSYSLMTDKHEIYSKKLDAFAKFQYLAKNDVRELFLDVNCVLHHYDSFDCQKWQTSIDSLKEKIDRDIEEYTTELKSLVKEE